MRGGIHHLAESLGNVSEILADDDCAMVRLASASAAIMISIGIAHVGAVLGGGAVRDKEELPERHGVVDAQRAGVAHGVVDQRAERRGARSAHRHGGERREAPVLPAALK